MRLATLALAVMLTAQVAKADSISFADLADTGLTSNLVPSVKAYEQALEFGRLVSGIDSADGKQITAQFYGWNILDDGVSPPFANPSLLPTGTPPDNAFFEGGPDNFNTVDQYGMIHGPFAYLDSNAAGLGVSSRVNANLQSVPSSDDNVSDNSAANSRGDVVGVALTGYQSMAITGFSVRNHQHIANFDFDDRAYIDYTDDGGLTWNSVRLDMVGSVSLAATQGSLLGFAYNDFVGGKRFIDGDSNNTSEDNIAERWSGKEAEFYIDVIEFTIPQGSPQVPEPGAFACFASLLCMAGVGMTSRRKRRN